MSKRKNKFPTVDKKSETDRSAIKIFNNWMPNAWLPRKQDPDYFVDYLVEIVENGEPTGSHFEAQVKGYEDTPEKSKPLKYSFKTKHLKYYLQCSKHPVVLFLINVRTKVGFWFFAQKHLKENVPISLLEKQETLSIPFADEDNLDNFTKFKYLLLEAERYVRDLHPGSPLAAIKKRKLDLEALDPRCVVDIDYLVGQEKITIRPNEPFSFSMNVKSNNIDGWKAFIEKGEIVRTTPGEISFVGMPLFQEVLNQSSEILLQIARPRTASMNIINCNSEFPDVTHIEGEFTAGTKFSRFVGSLHNSPLVISFELPHEHLNTRSSVNLSVEYSLSKWTAQSVLNLAGFEQIQTFAESFSGQKNPKIEFFVDGVRQVRGDLGGSKTPFFNFINNSLGWLKKVRWLAEHFKINPPLPSLDTIPQEDYNFIEEIHDVLRNRKVVLPKPHLELSIEIDPIPDQAPTPELVPKTLRLVFSKPTYNFWGTIVHLPQIEHIFTEINLTSETSIDGGKKKKLVFNGNEKSLQISSLIS